MCPADGDRRLVCNAHACQSLHRLPLFKPVFEVRSPLLFLRRRGLAVLPVRSLRFAGKRSDDGSAEIERKPLAAQDGMRQLHLRASPMRPLPRRALTHNMR